MRNIVEQPSVSDALDDAKERWQRVEDAWEAVTWVLARDPTVGLPMSEGGSLRSVVYDGSWAHEMSTIELLYQIEPHRIVVLEAKFSDASSSAGHA